MLNVWYIHLHLDSFGGKCRQIYIECLGMVDFYGINYHGIGPQISIRESLSTKSCFLRHPVIPKRRCFR